MFSRLSLSVFALTAIVCSLILGMSLQNLRASENYISVTGSSQQVIESDTATWRISLEHVTQDTLTLREGSETLASSLKVLLSYLAKQGFSGSSVMVQPVSVETNINYNLGNVPSSYRLHQSVVVQSNSVSRVTEAAKNSSTLLAQGAVISTSGVEYTYSRLPELRVELLSRATEDAKKRADSIARSAGSSLGKLQSASVGVFQVAPVNSIEISDYGLYDTTTVTKQVTAIVRASFDVK
ncbi:MAG: SIMPL domain-containing protein [Candidatus Peribacteraceae bacterium]